MTTLRPGWTQTKTRALCCLLVATVVLVALAVAACGSSDPAPEASSTTTVKTAIIKVLPRDASVEPPWNGRFVQVNVRVAEPGAMDPSDWRVFVNGKEPKLDKPANILPYSPTKAVVAFMFQAPYTDLGTYDFRVVYAPKGGRKVQLAWKYKW